MIVNPVRAMRGHLPVHGGNIDGPEMIRRHSRIIRQKPFLRQLYTDWYTSLRNALPQGVPGAVLELGSGGGFLREVIPEALTSDIRPDPNLCAALDATALPFCDRSLKAILMVDVLHHIPRVASFFEEASRCVNSGGVIAMIEPWNTAFSRLVYRHLHREPFEADAGSWHFPGGGPMSRSNQALPWILFQRDRSRFRQLFPQWQLASIRLHTPVRYLLSGGVSYTSFMPASTFAFWCWTERKLKPLMPALAMFATITLMRK